MRMSIWGCGEYHDSMDKDGVWLRASDEPLVFLPDCNTAADVKGWRCDGNSLSVTMNDPSGKFDPFDVPQWALQPGGHMVHLPGDMRLLLAVESVDDSSENEDDWEHWSGPRKFAQVKAVMYDKAQPWMNDG